MHILFWKDRASQFVQRDMNCVLLPLSKHRGQTVFEQLEDVFQEGSMSGSNRMISNGPVTKCEKRALVLALET